MDNVKIDVKDNKLTLEVDLKELGQLSKSGKSFVIASTHGFTWTKDLGISLNVIKKKNEK